VQELLEYALINRADIKKPKAKIISTRFGDINTFLEIDPHILKNIEYINGKKSLDLSKDELSNIIELQKSGLLAPALSIAENYISILSADFLDRQVKMLRLLSLKKLNASPILISALRLQTPEQIIKYYVYQSASRSIVTSMGFHVEKLLLISGPDVNVAGENGSQRTKWDLVKNKAEQMTAWIEVKSGPNDLDKAQILHYLDLIQAAESNGDLGFIGETYGKRSSDTMTHSLYKQYLPEWNRRTLIGRELWDFVSDDPGFHTKLIKILRNAAEKVLLTKSITEEMDDCISRILTEFNAEYEDTSNPVEAYLDDLW